MGDHVTDHGTAASLMELLKGRLHLPCIVDGHDVHLSLQQVAQYVGGLGDGGEAYYGIGAGVVFHQTYGPEYVIDAYGYEYDRQLAQPAYELRRTSSGYDGVIILILEPPGQLGTLLQISGIGVKMYARAALRSLLHGCTHTVIGGYAKYSYNRLCHDPASFLHISETHYSMVGL